MFKTIDVELPGFKYPKCKLKELNIRDMIQASKLQHQDDTQAFLFMVEKGLINDAGDRVFGESYTLDQFMDEMPQSVMVLLGEAVTALNSTTESQDLNTAKN